MFGWGMAYVNIINANSLEDLGLDNVADTDFGHDRDGYSFHDLLDHARIGLSYCCQRMTDGGSTP